jgi:glycosyltransferase involved in cell wall biosynthesis
MNFDSPLTASVQNDATIPSPYAIEYQLCVQLALEGKLHLAEKGLTELLQRVEVAFLRARFHNDLGVLASLDNRSEDASHAFQLAMALAPEWALPRSNLAQLATTAPTKRGSVAAGSMRRTRVAIVSLLFNWPSTGGGTVHTAEIGKFLSQTGYEVCHFVAEHSGWGVGRLAEPTLAPTEVLRFGNSDWSIPGIQSRFRSALKRFEPDWVIVTDSWNSKPILAEAVKDYPFLLRIAAQECLCPLNNVRLLYDHDGFQSCPKHQLATPADCCRCVYRNGKLSGGLHQSERELVGYGSQEYDRQLRWAFANAEAVLAVNPLIAAMVSPYAKKVCVIPSGFDAARFPDPVMARCSGEPIKILFAGLVNEPMKGFDVLHRACQKMWSMRQDFELLATADPAGQIDPFTRHTGWFSQADLPAVMSSSDIIACPTVAEEALGRTAVEAMGAGRPVVASRLGLQSLTKQRGCYANPATLMT